jgi:hypothetical protein
VRVDTGLAAACKLLELAHKVGLEPFPIHVNFLDGESFGYEVTHLGPWCLQRSHIRAHTRGTPGSMAMTREKDTRDKERRCKRERERGDGRTKQRPQRHRYVQVPPIKPAARQADSGQEKESDLKESD